MEIDHKSTKNKRKSEDRKQGAVHRQEELHHQK